VSGYGYRLERSSNASLENLIVAMGVAYDRRLIRTGFKTSFEPILRTFAQKRLAKRSVNLRALARVFKI
jgi:hypothetical protein